MVKGKYERILGQFEHYYPNLYEDTIDWWPSGRYNVTVKLSDGDRVEYDSISNTIRYVHSYVIVKDIDVFRKDIGNKIQKAIIASGISQSKVAESAGLTDAMLSRYIHGTSTPGLDKILNIAAAIGCDPSDLYSSYKD